MIVLHTRQAQASFSNERIGPAHRLHLVLSSRLALKSEEERRVPVRSTVQQCPRTEHDPKTTITQPQNAVGRKCPNLYTAGEK